MGTMSREPSAPYRASAPQEPDEPPPDPRGPWVLQTWTSRRSCPDCAVPLYAARQEGFRIDACGRCGGAWLDHTAVTRALEERSLVPAILAERAPSGAPAPGHDRPSRACPDCAKPLVATPLADARILVDTCDVHGTWFDPSEVRAAIEAHVRKRPPPVDPEVDRVIAEEARRGARRPPESYEPEYQLGRTGPDPTIFHTLFRAWFGR